MKSGLTKIFFWAQKPGHANQSLGKTKFFRAPKKLGEFFMRFLTDFSNTH